MAPIPGTPSPPGPAEGLRPLHAGWLLLVTAAALLLRLHALDREALWFDEVNTLWRTAGGGLLSVLARTAGDVQAPLFDLVLWALTSLTGRTDAWMVRLPSALAGAALVPVTFALARGTAASLGWTPARAAGAGLVAALLVTVAPFAVRFSQEARPYALLALLSGLVLLGALRAVTSQGRRGLLLLGAASVLLVLTHYYGVLLLAAVVLFLIADAGAFGQRLPAVVRSLLPALCALLLWAPVALRQFELRDMAGVYRPLGGATLLEILDAQGVHAAMVTAPRALAAQLGVLATAQPWALWGGRLLLLALLGTGAAVAWRRRGAGLPGAPAPGSCRRPAALIVALGVLSAGAALILSPAVIEDVASRWFKEGRTLDAENRAFLDHVRMLALVGGAGLLGLAVFVALLPALARRAGRGRAPGRLLVVCIGVPLLLTALLDLSGKQTLATRNMIMLAPASAALTALGLLRLEFPARAVCLLLLAILAGVSLAALPAYSAKGDWRGAGAAVSGSGAEPVCYPPWLARCVEYHARRPWNSVFGAWSVADIEAWAASRWHIVLIEAQEAETSAVDGAALHAALDRRFGPPAVQRFRGVTCSVYGP